MKSPYRIIPLILWSGVIVFGSSRGAVSVAPAQDLDVLIHKLAHLTEYAILYLCFVYALYPNRKQRAYVLIAGILFTFLFGFTDELHQSFTPTRSPKVSDAFIDMCGGVIGYVVIRLFLKKKE